MEDHYKVIIKNKVLGKSMTKENMPYKSIFTNEQELLNAILILHNDSNDIELDPMYNKGNFYKDIIDKPKYTVWYPACSSKTPVIFKPIIWTSEEISTNKNIAVVIFLVPTIFLK